jgi:erythromycin esterase-like protein
MVVCEADVLDMERVNRYIGGIPGDESAEEALSDFKRYPLWMWRNRVVADFLEWAKQHNE